MDNANLKIYELTRTVEMCKNNVDEVTQNLNLAMRNNQTLETRLQEKAEITAKLRLQHEMLVLSQQFLLNLLENTLIIYRSRKIEQ